MCTYVCDLLQGMLIIEQGFMERNVLLLQSLMATFTLFDVHQLVMSPYPYDFIVHDVIILLIVITLVYRTLAWFR